MPNPTGHLILPDPVDCLPTTDARDLIVRDPPCLAGP